MKFNFSSLSFDERNIFPEKMAILSSSNQLSWLQLEKATIELTLVLKSASLAQGTAVFITASHQPLEVAAILACQICGLTYVPISATTPIERALEMKEILSSDYLIDCSESSLPFGNVISYSNNWYFSKKSGSKLTKGLSKNYLYIIFTSGSTGTPKAVPISKENLIGFMQWFKTVNINFSTNDVFLNPFLFSFDGSQPALNFILNSGGSIILTKKEDDLDKMDLSQVTICLATSSWYQNAKRFEKFNYRNLSKIKNIFIGGELLNSYVVTSLKKNFPDSKVWNLYGPTETTIFVSALELTEDVYLNYNDAPLAKLDNLGPMRVVNRFTENQINYGEIEIYGEMVSDGYLNSADLTKKYFFSDSEGNKCFKTGDIVRIEDDYVFFASRNDSQIKLGGFRVELAEIESLVFATRLVNNCACVPIFRNGLPRRLLLFYVTTSEVENNIENNLRTQLAKFLIPQLIPSEFISVEEIPISQNFKVDKNELLKRYSEK